MKTKYIKIITFVLVLISFTACTDYLTVKPQGQVILGDFWKSESDVDAVIATCYRELLSSNNMTNFITWGEVRSDNLTNSFNTPEEQRKILEGIILPTNSYTSWGSLYTLINYCNSVLYYSPMVVDPNFTDAELKAKQAEALTLRALAYFYLVRAFRDVPMVLEPSLSDQQDYNVSQSSEDVVLDQLESDLLKAEGWAMNNYGRKEYNKGRVTKAAVRALLADIYLWRNKYAQSITYCDKIIQDPLFELIKADDQPYFKIFGLKNSTESIFEIQYTQSSNTLNSSVFRFYGSSESTDYKPYFTVPKFIAEDNTVYINTPEISDVRRKDYIRTKDESGFYRIFKYTGKIRTENSIGNSEYSYRNADYDSPNWIFYRLTDIMLMKAEALVQLNGANDHKNALEIVNTVYLRSNPTIIDSLELSNYTTKKELEELVLVERQRELIFEGKRWFDLLRLARRDGKTDRLIRLVIRKSDNTSVLSSKLKDMNALYWPVSEYELKANPNLKQNPFYKNDLMP